MIDPMDECITNPPTSIELPFVRVLPCTSAEDLLCELRPSHVRWRSDPFNATWLFRGQGVTDAPKATLWRAESCSIVGQMMAAVRAEIERRCPDPLASLGSCAFEIGPSKSRRTFEQLPADARRARERSFAFDVLTEISLLRRFWEVAERAGHAVARPDWLQGSAIMNDERLQVILDAQQGHREEMFEQPLVAIARHHELPARLIDWTTNPLFAAYFACQGPVSSDGGISIWAIPREWMVRLGNCPLREYRPPRHLLPRLANQEGRFLWQPNAHEFYAIQGRWPSMIDSLEEAWRRAGTLQPSLRPLMKLTLPMHERHRLLELLWHERVFGAKLMDDLDQIAPTIYELMSVDRLHS